MEAIGRRFLPWQIGRLVKKNRASRGNIAFSKARKIGIIFSSESKKKFDLIQEFIDELTNEKKDVTTLVYVGRRGDVPPAGLPYFTHKELTWFGEISNEKVLDFADKEFDYLFCFDLEPGLYIENVLAMSRAQCRIGHYQGDEKNKYFELMINTKGSIEDLIRDMRHFTKSLIKQ